MEESSKTFINTSPRHKEALMFQSSVREGSVLFFPSKTGRSRLDIPNLLLQGLLLYFFSSACRNVSLTALRHVATELSLFITVNIHVGVRYQSRWYRHPCNQPNAPVQWSRDVCFLPLRSNTHPIKEDETLWANNWSLYTLLSESECQ